jgi:hypothetical protein
MIVNLYFGNILKSNATETGLQDEIKADKIRLLPILTCYVVEQKFISSEKNK